MMRKSRAVGSNPPLDSTLFRDFARTDSNTVWLASGRDALALAAAAIDARIWLVPDFICGAVPATLQKMGATLLPYTVGRLDSVTWDLLDRSTCAVLLLWDLGEAPSARDRLAARNAAAILEDRCLWVGQPSEVPSGTWAFGSSRKWIGGAGAGWLVPADALPEIETPTPRTYAQIVLASSALRSVREQALGDELEAASIMLNEAADRLLGVPTTPRRASEMAVTLADRADPHAERAARRSTAIELCGRLGVREMSDGGSGLRVRSTCRDEIASRLRDRRIYATVHWRDGDWCGRATTFASQTLTIPIPAFDNSSDVAAFATAVEEALTLTDWIASRANGDPVDPADEW